MEIKLLKTKEEELSKITELAELIWKKYYIEIITIDQIEYMMNKFYSNDSLKTQILNGQIFYFVKFESEVLGFLSLSKDHNGIYFIHKFYLLPDQHRKSVGTAVMQEIENEINITEKVKNYKIKLTVNRQNFKAINFYFKNGFTIESVEDFDIGESYLMNDFVMVKNVNNSF
jgi:ribosomal protein S18 acetylase RimI-like enzyme